MTPRSLHVLAGAVLSTGLLLAACSTPKPAPSTTAPGVDCGAPCAVEHDGVVCRFDPSIDRFTHFGPTEGPNLLHVTGLDRTPSPTGDYTFFGGAYTWIAPQNGAKGWVDGAGAPKGWPPDPLMDIGPARIVSRTESSFNLVGPRTLSGLREEKSFRTTGPGQAEFTYTLHNTTNAPVTAGPWINTAVAPGDGSVLAFRVSIAGGSPAYERWGAMGDDAEKRFDAALGMVSAHGWAALPLDSARWADGIKVYLDAGNAPAEIAVWRGGWWLHRRLLSGDAATHKRLRELGEGPVATYINPGLGIIEAELVAPIVDIPANGSTTAVERWMLIHSPTPDPGVLPR